MKITTIKLTKQTKKRLDHLRTHKRDSYEDILQRILKILNICRINPEAGRAHLVAIDKQNRKQRPKTIKKPQQIKQISYKSSVPQHSRQSL